METPASMLIPKNKRSRRHNCHLGQDKMRIKITRGNLSIAVMMVITIFVLYLGASMILMDPREPMGYGFLVFVIFMIIIFYKEFTGTWSERPGVVTKTSVTCKSCGRTASLEIRTHYDVSIHGLPSKTAYDDHCPFCGKKY
jgi:hypothetical protein